MSDGKPGQGGRARGLGLLSGGLDSRLAACVIRSQGIEVRAVTFESAFFSAAKGRAAAEALGIPLSVVPFQDDIVALIEHPPHGFGAGMNPCIDCHARMLRRAGELMRELGFDFLFTGEILNQRPMSQNRRSLELVARASGFADLIVRPLSARLLPETEAERRGLVDRARLLDLEGRTRARQFAMAESFGLADRPPVGGGCCLTEPHFAARVRDLRAHGALRDPAAVALLRFGRHFRLDGGVKLIVGRDEADNEAIERLAPPDAAVLTLAAEPGPTCLLAPAGTEEQTLAAARFCVAHSRRRTAPAAEVRVRRPGGAESVVLAAPAAPAAIEAARVA